LNEQDTKDMENYSVFFVYIKIDTAMFHTNNLLIFIGTKVDKA